VLGRPTFHWRNKHAAGVNTLVSEQDTSVLTIGFLRHSEAFFEIISGFFIIWVIASLLTPFCELAVNDVS